MNWDEVKRAARVSKRSREGGYPAAARWIVRTSRRNQGLASRIDDESLSGLAQILQTGSPIRAGSNRFDEPRRDLFTGTDSNTNARTSRRSS